MSAEAALRLPGVPEEARGILPAEAHFDDPLVQRLYAGTRGRLGGLLGEAAELLTAWTALWGTAVGEAGLDAVAREWEASFPARKSALGRSGKDWLRLTLGGRPAMRGRRPVAETDLRTLYSAAEDLAIRFLVRCLGATEAELKRLLPHRDVAEVLRNLRRAGLLSPAEEFDYLGMAHALSWMRTAGIRVPEGLQKRLAAALRFRPTPEDLARLNHVRERGFDFLVERLARAKALYKRLADEGNARIAAERERMRQVMGHALAERWDWGYTARRLAMSSDGLAGWRDWDRVARTEMVNAANAGAVAAIRARFRPGTRSEPSRVVAYRQIIPSTVCPACRVICTTGGKGSAPRLFFLDEMEAQPWPIPNVREFVEAADAPPPVGTIHPNCGEILGEHGVVRGKAAAKVFRRGPFRSVFREEVDAEGREHGTVPPGWRKYFRDVAAGRGPKTAEELVALIERLG